MIYNFGYKFHEYIYNLNLTSIKTFEGGVDKVSIKELEEFHIIYSDLWNAYSDERDKWYNRGSNPSIIDEFHMKNMVVLADFLLFQHICTADWILPYWNQFVMEYLSAHFKRSNMQTVQMLENYYLVHN